MLQSFNFSWTLLHRLPGALVGMGQRACTLKSSKSLGYPLNQPPDFFSSNANEYVFLGADVKLTRAT